MSGKNRIIDLSQKSIMEIKDNLVFKYHINDCKFDIKSFIQEIITKEFKIDYWDEWLEKQDYEEIKEEPNLLVSCERENELIGICSIKVISKDECYLNSFYVKKEYRKKSIGGKLYEICEEYAKENNYKMIRLKVDPNFKDAICFYIKRNYVFDGYDETLRELNYHKEIRSGKL